MPILYQSKAAAPADVTVTDFQLFADAQETTKPVYVAFPGSGVLDAQPAMVGAIGYAESDGDMTYQVKLYAGTTNSLEVTDLIELGDGTAGTVAAGTRSVWQVSAPITYVADAGIMIGSVGSMSGDVLTPPVALANPVENLDGNQE